MNIENNFCDESLSKDEMESLYQENEDDMIQVFWLFVSLFVIVSFILLNVMVMSGLFFSNAKMEIFIATAVILPVVSLLITVLIISIRGFVTGDRASLSSENKKYKHRKLSLLLCKSTP